MSVYSIADLHLSTSVSKPMDIFGYRWQGYTEKIKNRWSSLVCDGDTVVVPGDISWALTLEEALSDLQYIDSLPGKKLLGKGNHDFWWSTMSKMKAFLSENGITSIDFLYNNAFLVEDYVICGSRGWYVEEKLQNTAADNADYGKIVAREAIRLEMSILEAQKIRPDSSFPILCYFHFPPVFNSFVCREIIDVLHKYNVKHCYFGHIHGNYTAPRTVEFEGISFTMVSADYLNFVPMITMPIDYDGYY